MNTNKSTKSKIIIYRDQLLPKSETFIKEQANALNDYQPLLLGSKLIAKGDLEGFNSLYINKGDTIGRIKEIVFKFSNYDFGISKSLAQLDPKLIHAHFGPDGYIAEHYAKRLKIPLVVTFHGYDITVKDEYMRNYSFIHNKYVNKKNEIINNSHTFIAVSNFIKTKLLEKGFPESKIVQHYIGIDTDKFKPAEGVNRDSIILFVGRIVEKKGLYYLIKAMESIQKNKPDVKLVVIGDGPQRIEMENLSKKTLSNYTFLGTQSPEEVKRWLNIAKVFCVPSITAVNGDAEGFGMVFAEANAMGVPVVSFSSGGIPEAVKHEETGFLVKEKDTNMLTSCLLELIENEDLWLKMSTKGIKRVNSKFNIKRQTVALEKIYDRIVSENSYSFSGV